MNVLTPIEILHTIAWFIALVELVMALYVLMLNAWNTANRHLSVLLLVFAANSFGLGLFIRAADISQTALPAFLLALTTEPVKLGLLIIATVLFKPEWLRGRWRWVWWLSYAFFFLPMILSVIDMVWNTGLWYVSLNPDVYTSGYVGGGEYVTGAVARIIRLVYAYVVPLLAFIPLVSAAVNRESSREERRLAWILTVIQAVVIVMVFALRPVFSAIFGLDENQASAASLIATSTFFAMAYAYAAFMQMVSERRVQRGRLQPRLTALVLIVTVPTLLAIAALVISRSAEMLRDVGFEKLETVNQALGANVDLWVDSNVQTLESLVQQPEAVSMDAVAQTRVLESIDALNEDIYLVSTTNLDGVNVARSDGASPTDYGDRPWFTAVKDGAPLAFQALVGKTSGEPSLVVSMPIVDEGGVLVGVGMFATDLDALADEIAASRFGETGIAYVVDAENHIIAHPDPTYAAELRDASELPVITAMREQSRGTTIVDDAGERWHAAFAELDYGWGVVVQQTWDELRSPLFRLGLASGLALLFGGLMLIALTYFTMRQAFAPINSLSETATAIADGDLNREAPVESEDELGALALTFNRMTMQLRELIGSLEQRVSARTFDLEQRSAALQASAEVGQAAASILNIDQLVVRVVDLIRERFGLYYVGLFLVDDNREWAVLQSGTGAAGRAMLARNHRIRVGEGMIGWSVDNAQARIASIAEEDAVRLTNPDLPETRSEAALPLRSRGQVLGALTVQSAQPDAFDEDMLTVLQTMADQVAVAIDNARLYSSAQEALEAERRAYGVRTREAWEMLTQTRMDWGYVATRQSDSDQLSIAEPAEGQWRAEMQQAQQSGQRVQADDASVIAVPIRARDQVIGVLRFDRGTDGAPWSDEDVELLETLTDQLGQTLERAQLYQDTQRRAARERIIADVGTRIRESLEMETLLRTAASEMRQALGLEAVIVRLATADGVDNVPVT